MNIMIKMFRGKFQKMLIPVKNKGKRCNFNEIKDTLESIKGASPIEMISIGQLRKLTVFIKTRKCWVNFDNGLWTDFIIIYDKYNPDKYKEKMEKYLKLK